MAWCPAATTSRCSRLARRPQRPGCTPIFDRGYCEDTSMWPWELCELFNLAAAVEQGADFDVIHYQAEYSPMSLAFTRLSATPVLQTLHHAPTAPEVALWSRYPEAPFVAVSHDQARALAGLSVVAVIPHAIDTAAYPFRSTPRRLPALSRPLQRRKGRAAGHRGCAANREAARSRRRRERVLPRGGCPARRSDSRSCMRAKSGTREKAALLGGARALLYPVQSGEPFGLVMAEAMACGTPVAALDRGAVREVVDEGTTGCVFDSLDALVEGLPSVLALDRALVRARAMERFSPDRMVDAYLDVYARLAASRLRHAPQEGRR